MSPLTKEQLSAAGDVCKKCRAAILWATTPAGKAMPVDPEPVFGGNLVLEVDAVGMLRTKVVRAAGDVEAYVAHFVSCSDPAAFRKPESADQVPDHEQQLERRKQAGRKVMPFGKYSGEYLDDVVHSSRGRAYLEWLNEEGIKKPDLREAVEIVLGERQ